MEIIRKKGTIGKGKHKSIINGKQNKAYTVWSGIIRRCYSKKSHKRQPTYIGCSIDENWLDFQVFADWYEKFAIDNYCLDKDILIKGNKLYSPDTCTFIPQEINKLLGNCKKIRGVYPIGVGKYKNGTYRASLRINGDQKHLGVFTTIVDAFKSYKIAKENEVKRVAIINKDNITEACYKALINYTVEITD